MENLFINIWKKAKRKRKKELTFWDAFGSILVMALTDGGSRSFTFVTLQDGPCKSSQRPCLAQAARTEGPVARPRLWGEAGPAWVTSRRRAHSGTRCPLFIMHNCVSKPSCLGLSYQCSTG